MKHYSLERKEVAVQKMMPPSNTPIATLTRHHRGNTLYNWRKQTNSRGLTVY